MDAHSKNNAVITYNLTLGYDEHPIVSHLTLAIQSGEFIGILGPNGSGKSTFLRALLGLIKPLSGNILVLNSRPQKGHKKIGYMPQTRHLVSLMRLTGQAIIEAAFEGTRYGLPFPSKQKKEHVQKMIALVHAEKLASRSFNQLSGGERQRIFLAQALLNDPHILLLDEPLANLDPASQEMFIQLLYDVQQQLNMTILFTAHDANPLLSVMNRVLYFAKGKAAIGSTHDIITSAQLSALYETPIEVIQHKNRLIVLGEPLNKHEHE